MPRKAVDSIPILYIERILREYTDDDHALSVSQIRNKLQSIYGCDISNDKTKQLLGELFDFYDGDLSARSDGISNLYPNAILKYERIDQTNPRSKLFAQMTGGALSPAELSYVRDSLSSLPFLRKSASDDLSQRIEGLLSYYQRANRRELAVFRAQEAKPEMFEVINTLEGVSRAIEDRLTISCDYGRYTVEPMTARPKFSLEPNDFSNTKVRQMSPYLLTFMDEHYFLVGDWGIEEPSSRFRTLRVDLIRNLTVNKDPSRFKSLDDPDEARNYMNGAVSGFGGESELIRMKCSAFAVHYVIERFSEFEGFRIVPTASREEGSGRMYEIEFFAVPMGFKYWAIKQLQNIEVLEPIKLREEIKQAIRCCPYLREEQA